MQKKKEVAQDIIKDMPKKKAKPKAKVANSGNQEQNQQSLSESQPRYKPLNDLGNAERFVEQHGGRVFYCPELNCWFVYVDGLWVQDTGITVADSNPMIQEIHFGNRSITCKNFVGKKDAILKSLRA